MKNDSTGEGDERNDSLLDNIRMSEILQLFEKSDFSNQSDWNSVVRKWDAYFFQSNK